MSDQVEQWRPLSLKSSDSTAATHVSRTASRKAEFDVLDVLQVRRVESVVAQVYRLQALEILELRIARCCGPRPQFEMDRFLIFEADMASERAVIPVMS